MWQPPERNAAKILCHSSPSHCCHQMSLLCPAEEPRVSEGAQGRSLAQWDHQASPSWTSWEAAAPQPCLANGSGHVQSHHRGLGTRRDPASTGAHPWGASSAGTGGKVRCWLVEQSKWRKRSSRRWKREFVMAHERSPILCKSLAMSHKTRRRWAAKSLSCCGC